MAKRQADGQRTKDESSDEEVVDVSELVMAYRHRGRVADRHSLVTATSLSHPSQEDRECGYKGSGA
jgi:hypothetical protein